MFEINILNTSLFALIFLGLFYAIVCVCHKKVIKLEFRRLLYYVTAFSLLGIIGEVFVNTLYTYFLGTPLWEYRLFPAHGGDISYFFLAVWGSLGFYKYVLDTVYKHTNTLSHVQAGLVMGSEAVFLELLYNGLFFLTFDNYIFFYFPTNVGPLSHLSCLQVIPFYFVFGYVVMKIIKQQEATRGSSTLIIFYWMIILTFVFLT